MDSERTILSWSPSAPSQGYIDDYNRSRIRGSWVQDIELLNTYDAHISDENKEIKTPFGFYGIRSDFPFRRC
jgi:hypothetical protein